MSERGNDSVFTEDHQLRTFHSESALSQGHGVSTARPDLYIQKPRKQPVLIGAKSEPTLSLRKPHPLLDTSDDSHSYSYNELILAAETLENIVNEGTLIGSIRPEFRSLNKIGVEHSGREMTDHVLKLVYGTMKCTSSDHVDMFYHDLDKNDTLLASFVKHTISILLFLYNNFQHTNTYFWIFNVQFSNN